MKKLLLLFASLVSLSAHAANPAVLFGSPYANSLLPGISFPDGSSVSSGALDPTSSAVPAGPGSLYMSTGGGVYVKSDSGLTTNWTLLGDGSVSSVSASPPLFSSGGSSPNITCQSASGSQAGCLASSDWSLFNGKTTANLVSGTPTGDANIVLAVALTSTIDSQFPVATPTVIDGPVSFSGGEADFTGDTSTAVEYDSSGISDNNVFTIGINFRPNYSGASGAGQSIFCQRIDGILPNLLILRHDASGFVHLVIFDSNGSLVTDTDVAMYSAVSGVKDKFELDVDGISSKVARVFKNGTQLGSDVAVDLSGSGRTASGIITVGALPGNYTSDAHFSGLYYYGAVLHTTTFTPSDPGVPVAASSGDIAFDYSAGAFYKYTSSWGSALFKALSSSLTSAHIYVGNGSNIGTSVAVSGDATLSNAGVVTVGTHAAEQALGTLAWTGSVAPTGTISKTYSWTRAGKNIYFWAKITASVPGTAVTAVAFPIPGDMPAPAIWATQAANSLITLGVGSMTAAESDNLSQGGCGLYDDGSSSFKFKILDLAGLNVGAAQCQLTYRVN